VPPTRIELATGVDFVLSPVEPQ